MGFEELIKRGIVTEKSARLKESNRYQFEVAAWANKYQIKKAVEALFNVKVVDVKTCNYRGKTRRMGVSTGKNRTGRKRPLP